MKKFKVDCEFALFPFGDGCPVCVKKHIKTGIYGDLRQCDHVHCSFYKAVQDEKAKKAKNAVLPPSLL